MIERPHRAYAAQPGGMPPGTTCSFHARIGWSILAALVMNLILAVNHRPGRCAAL